MNVFDAVKDELSARQIVEAYGIHVRHNGMCCCPFHGDKNPSMKVDDKRYHCFGCGEDGDVIQFVARYFDLSRYEAAKKLSEDFGISYDSDVFKMIDDFASYGLRCHNVVITRFAGQSAAVLY